MQAVPRWQQSNRNIYGWITNRLYDSIRTAGEEFELGDPAAQDRSTASRTKQITNRWIVETIKTQTACFLHHVRISNYRSLIILAFLVRLANRRQSRSLIRLHATTGSDRCRTITLAMLRTTISIYALRTATGLFWRAFKRTTSYNAPADIKQHRCDNCET